MNRPYDNSVSDARRQSAAAWRVRLEREDASADDWRDFERWVANRENRAAYDRLDALVLEIEDRRDELAALIDGANIVHVPVARAVPSAIWMTGAAAAAALAFFGLRALAPPPARTLAYAAPSTGTLNVTLPDGSVVSLNRGTHIAVRLQARSRDVKLSSGEAAFAVAHDGNQPFTVTTGGTTIKDIGTEFDVISQPKAVTVTVRAGAVSVESSTLPATPVVEGQRLRAPTAGRASLEPVNAADAFAWRDGRLIYHDAPLAEVAADLSRYGSLPVRVADARAAQLRFSGVLVIDNSRTMVARLEAFLPLRSTQDDQGIALRSR